MNTYSDWLAHHGIPGMHWGERNGPPYPLSTPQYTKEELKAKKKAARGYNKEIRKAEGRLRKNYDTVLTEKRQHYDKKLKKIYDTSKTDEEKDYRVRKLIEKRDNDKRLIKAYKYMEEGNKKILEILDRAEAEGGLDLVQTKQYAVNGKGRIAQQFGVLGSLSALAISGGAKNLTEELTDKYRVKVSDQYKKDVKQNKEEMKKVLPPGYKPPQDTRLPDSVASEIWKGIARKVETSGETSLTIANAEKYANEIRQELLKDENSEYYKYVHGKR